MKTKKKEGNIRNIYVCVYNKKKTPGSLDALGISRGFKIKTHTHLSNHVQSDNEDFVCASGSLCHLHMSTYLKKCVFISPPSLKTLFSNDLFDEAQ
jgi:hypothetical protein